MSLHSRANYSSKFSIDDIRMASGPPEGVTFDGDMVQISESLCADLPNGQFETIVVTYSIAGEWGLEIPKTAIFNLSASTDGPVITSHLEGEPFLKNGAYCFDLSSDHFR